jgi:hypothetical protein
MAVHKKIVLEKIDGVPAAIDGNRDVRHGRRPGFTKRACARTAKAVAAMKTFPPDGT